MVEQSYPFQQFLAVELSYKVDVCFHFIHVSNIVLSTYLWLVSIVPERIQVSKINHLRVKLQINFPTNLLNFQHSILPDDILHTFLPNPLLILHILLHLKFPTQIQILL